MIGLRLVLLALALAVFAAVGWRLATPGVVRVAGGPAATVSAPIVPAPSVAPPTVASPTPPALPAAPAAVRAPTAPTATTPSPPAAPTVPAAPAAAPQKPAPDSRAAVLSTIAGAPDLARAFALIQSEFPTVAEHALASATDAARSGAVPPVDDIVAGAMRDLRTSSGVLAARAGPEALAALFDAKAATLADLQAADARMCADYVFGGTSPEFNDFAIAHRALVARQDIATVAAMADGRARKMSWDAPSTEDFDGLEAALKGKGLNAVEIAAVLDGKTPDPPLPDDRVCSNARAYLDAMRSMPPDARNRIYGLAADLLARS